MLLAAATNTESEEICALMNLAYRSGQGWTSESNLVDGSRITLQQVQQQLSESGSKFLVHKIRNRVVACVCLESSNETVHIGSFAVDPEYQGSGLGSRVLAAAEQYARDNLSAKKYAILVLSPRHELISFYERRGYKRTGKTSPFPTHLNVGTPVLENLLVDELEKTTDHTGALH